MEEGLARARTAEGIALSTLDRDEEALAALRLALPVFEHFELGSNSVGALNSIAVCLRKLGRVDEARREYARLLRRISPRDHRSRVGFLRFGLAQLLFSAERYREAALSFGRSARLLVEAGFEANALTAFLFEIESWARSESAPAPGIDWSSCSRKSAGSAPSIPAFPAGSPRLSPARIRTSSVSPISAERRPKSSPPGSGASSPERNSIPPVQKDPPEPHLTVGSRKGALHIRFQAVPEGGTSRRQRAYADPWLRVESRGAV